MIQKKFATLKTVLLHTIVLLIIFCAAVFGFERYINQTTPTTSAAMDASSFPLVYMQNNGVNYNCLHGYAYEMDVNYIRDTVTVLDGDHILDLQIQPFDTQVESVSYEVLTLDGSESLENTNVIKLTEDGGYLDASLEIQNHMLLEQEYILKLQVRAGGRDIYYYTRLLLEDGLHLEAYLDFATGFFEKCINKQEQDLGVVAEPDETTGTSKTLAQMDIHDTVNQLMWGELNPQMYYKPTPSLVDINGTTASFVLDYRISAVNKEGINEIFNVKEFYRLRYTDTRIFLLDFTRTTEEIFNTNKTVLESDGINLGIVAEDVEFAFNEDKTTVAFVLENELWTYKINGGRMTRVFGFPQQENMDYRDFYDKNNIRIQKVNEAGDVWFAVSGYMNRGMHEGENGIGIYCYEEASATVQELLFVQTMESYDTLKLDIDVLSYITEDQSSCYLMLEGIIYRINLVTGKYEAIVEDIKNDCYASSKSGRYFSWLGEGKRYDSRTLYTIDLENGTTREVTCAESERLRPIGYLGEDLVYGKALVSDIDSSSEGNELFPMYHLTIVNEEGAEVKNYEQGGIYIMDTQLGDNMLKLTRATRENGVYTETTEDHIVSTDTQDDVIYGVTTQESSVKQTEMILRVGRTITDKNVQVVNSKILKEEESRTIRIPTNAKKENLYYVYAQGKMESCWSTAAEAIRRADEKVGVVINNAKEFVWERGNKKESSKIRLENIPDAIRSGSMDVAALEAAIGKDVVDLTNCTLDQVLYFVSQGRPVIAATPTGSTIITGYDDYGNLILLDPGASETYFYGPNDSKELFETAGNRFISYLNTEL